MERVTMYQIASGPNSLALQVAVAKFLGAGWQPHGSIVIDHDGKFYQPMIWTKKVQS